nr:DUF3848 domain-containing protein [uncultured Oscillibacter sp.]
MAVTEMKWTQIHDELFKRINREMDNYASGMWKRPGNEVYDQAVEISAMRFCYNQLIGSLSKYQAEDLKPLLQYEKPLEVVCRRWLSEQSVDLSEEFAHVLFNPDYLDEAIDTQSDMDIPSMI